MPSRHPFAQFALTLLVGQIATVVTTATFPITAVAQPQTEADRKVEADRLGQEAQ